MKNAVQLVAYCDRLGGDLRGLRRILSGPLDGLFGGVHVLPFFKPFDGSDAGFDPEDHTAVDHRLGDWDDVAALAAELDVMADVIVNHISVDSVEFRGFLGDGHSSEFAGMFLTMDSVFPDGATEDSLTRIYRPRPGLPFTSYRLQDGTRRLVWTTFTDRQADIDVAHPRSIAYLHAVLERMATHGVKMIRLDAVGYAVKRQGTSCFVLPETIDFIKALTAQAHGLGMEALVEVHAHYETQIEISKQADYIYDFALAPLMLHGLTASDVEPLLRWLDVRPTNVVSVLDTHDGIGVIDVGKETIFPGRSGLLDDTQIDELVRAIHANTKGASAKATGAAASNVDLYQVNTTFFDALGRDEERYLLARAVQFFLPGVPQVYYVGLLCGTNDVQLLARTGVGRDINRHCYTDAEIMGALQKTAVRRLIDLIRLRTHHPAFAGSFTCARSANDAIVLSWINGAATAELAADFRSGTYRVAAT